VKVELRLIEFSAVKTIVSESRVVLETSYVSVHTIFCCWMLSSADNKLPAGAAEQREAQLRSRRKSR
jgi:hypothetical protein